MRKLIGAATALALILAAASPALAQQVPSFNLYGPVPAGTNVIGKVGIDQTTAGTTNGVVVNSSALPSGAATAAKQDTGNGSLSAIATNTTGAALDGADPSSPVVANAGTGIRGWLATIAGLSKLGPAAKAGSTSVGVATDLANLEPAGAPVTGSALSSGGAGLTGWLSQIWLGNVTRMVPYTDANAVSVPASGTAAGAVHDAGSPGAYTRATATGYSQQGGTLRLVACLDSGCASYFVIGTPQTVAAGGNAYTTANLASRYWQAQFINGSGSASSTTYILSSQTAN